MFGDFGFDGLSISGIWMISAEMIVGMEVDNMAAFDA